MADNFYMSQLNRSISDICEDFHLFGYVGDRERLNKEVSTKSVFRRLAEILAPRLNIGTILKTLTTFDLLRVDPDKTLAKEIINFIDQQENNRKLTQLLQFVYRKGRRNGTYFDRVANAEYKKATLFEGNFNSIQDRLITVEGQLVHRSAVPQFSPSLAATLRASSGEWILSDFPPHGLVSANSRFNGKVLLLREDPGFTKTFSHYLPFSPELAWYPFLRVTGIFDASYVQTDIFPSLSVSLVEYRRPKIFREMRAEILRFGASELDHPIFLKEWSELLLFGYVVPILFKGSNLLPSDADVETTKLLRDYRGRVGNDLPTALVEFFDSLPN